MKTIIIGAGILGASTAFHLARSGARVTIIDAHRDGRATAAGAGIICPWVSGVEDEPFYRLYASGGEYYPELIAALADHGETDTGYRQTGAMLVSADPAEVGWLERMVSQRQAQAMGKISRLSPTQARAAFPPLRPDLAAIHIAGGARVDGRRMAASLLRAAERRGAIILQGEAHPVIRAGRIIGVSLNGQTEPADQVIVTAGAWANETLRPIGQTLPIEPQRGQIVHLHLPGQQTPDQQTKDWPVILPPGSHYIVPFDNGRVVAGATRETGVGFDHRVTAAGLMEVLAQALDIAPGLKAATVIETRIGFRPLAPGMRPMLGPIPDIPGLIIGNGLGAAGLTIGPFAGRLLADLALGRPGPIDLESFSATRQPALRTLPAPALR